MIDPSRLLIVLAVVAGATGLWALVQRHGRGFRPTGPAAPVPALTAADLGGPLGTVATFVQFSTQACAVCPQVRRTLAEVAAEQPGVRHVEVSAEERLDLVRRHGVMRSPTVLLVGPDGTVRARTSGALSAQDARAELATLRSDRAAA